MKEKNSNIFHQWPTAGFTDSDCKGNFFGKKKKKKKSRAYLFLRILD